MSNSPKLTIVLPKPLLDHYRAQAVREERSVSATVCRTLRIAAGLPLDPEADAKTKTPELPLT